MNTTGLLTILRYLLLWHRVLGWMVLIGLAVLIMVPLVALVIDSRTAMGVSMYAFGSALGVPYAFASIPFRRLIASRRLAMVPGLQLRAGQAFLLLTLLTAFFLPLCSALLWPGILHPLFGSSLFIAASLLSLLMQWAITSPHMLLLLSFGPFIVVFALVRSAPLLAPYFFNPASNLALFTLCLAGWFVAFAVLARRRNFAPVFVMPFNNTDYLWSGAGWARLTGPSRSATGTLLLAYPDGIANRLYNTLNIVTISPLVAVLCIWLVGLPAQWEANSRMINLFMLFSMVAAIISAVGNGELAARCRLVWIRQGSSRQQQWTLLEGTLFSSLLMLWSIVVLSAGLIALIDPTARAAANGYLLITLSCTLLGSYFSLLARISNWPALMFLLMIFIMGPGVAFAITRDALSLPLLTAPIVAVALVFRQLARQRFSLIDWFVVKPHCHPLKSNSPG